ncbi:glycosyltransferase family 4 protein [Hoeflea poritis]|uniref:Glycosyltransferase family 4 protein n=1 Tax=Hoeflea poritis TaxID=2993659 RepID=A0ABT4VGF8_9HYPH|nr:glycosyltransferase family 4 protein [Hoeflea poritis]MDA4843790.1 glycosyltransferase family 4 protein [Hoeflea poritis]
MGGNIVVVLKGYPRLSETFIAQELLELERAGYNLHLFSLRRPTDKACHPIHDEIKAKITYLPEYLHEEPMRVLRGWMSSRRLKGYRLAVRTFLKDLLRDRTRNRIRRFGQALVLARELPGDTDWLYAHFIHTPGSVTYYGHLMTGVGWSCSAHAKDIWTSPDWELSEKLDNASWTATCTRSGFEHLRNLATDKGSVHLVHHGLDLSRFPPPEASSSKRDGSQADDPVRIVTVGRAVAKKGLDTLLDALALLPPDIHWKWTHIGGGVLYKELAEQITRLGLSDRAEMIGAKPQEFVLQTYRDSDLFVLPCRIAADGDRDGLPNVLVEAQSQGLACISSPISGIVELIEDGRNGLLTPPDDAQQLSRAIEELVRDPVRRGQMGAAGARRVTTEFDHLVEIKRLLALFAEVGVEAGYQEAAQ